MIDKGTGADGAYTATGATFTTGGTASACGYNTYGPDNAFDGNTSTYWQSEYPGGGGAGHWIKYDLGSGVTKCAKKLRIYNSGATGGPSNNGIAGFYFQGSNDDSSWDTLITDTCPAAAQWYDFYCPQNVTFYRYYRIYSTGSYHADAIIIREIEMIGDVLASGTYNFTSLTVNSSVDLICLKPVTIKCQGTITVNGGLHCGGVLNMNSDVLTIGASGIVSGNLTIWNYTLNNSGIITGDALVACSGTSTIVHTIGAISAVYNQTVSFKTPSDIVHVPLDAYTAVNTDTAYTYFYIGSDVVFYRYAYSPGPGGPAYSDSVDVTTGWSNATTANTYLYVGNRISGSSVAGVLSCKCMMGDPKVNRVVSGLPLHYLHR